MLRWHIVYTSGIVINVIPLPLLHHNRTSSFHYYTTTGLQASIITPQQDFKLPLLHHNRTSSFHYYTTIGLQASIITPQQDFKLPLLHHNRTSSFHYYTTTGPQASCYYTTTGLQASCCFNFLNSQLTIFLFVSNRISKQFRELSKNIFNAISKHL